MAMYKQLSASTQIKVGASRLIAIVVSSTSSGTLKFYDSKDGDTGDPVIINTLTPAAATYLYFGEGGIATNNGLYVVVANTIEATIVYE